MRTHGGEGGERKDGEIGTAVGQVAGKEESRRQEVKERNGG